MDLLGYPRKQKKEKKIGGYIEIDPTSGAILESNVDPLFGD